MNDNLSCNKYTGICKWLRRYSQEPGPPIKNGLMEMQALKSNAKPGQHSIKNIGVQFFRNGKGLMINYCPFCGNRIDWFRDRGVFSGEVHR